MPGVASAYKHTHIPTGDLTNPHLLPFNPRWPENPRFPGDFKVFVKSMQAIRPCCYFGSRRRLLVSNRKRGHHGDAQRKNRQEKKLNTWRSNCGLPGRGVTARNEAGVSSLVGIGGHGGGTLRLIALHSAQCLDSFQETPTA